MSFKSKRTITNMAVGMILTVTYVLYIMRSLPQEKRSLPSWAGLILIFIGIGIGTMIVVQILFHIVYSIAIAVKEGGEDEEKIERLISSSAIEDEMDSIIGMKSARVAQICSGIGFVGALIFLTLGYSTVMALHIQLASIMLGTLIEGMVSVYFYERGV